MIDALSIGEIGRVALGAESRRLSRGEVLTTGRLLRALSEADGRPDWQRLWLETGDPLGTLLAETPDEPDESVVWEGLPVSGAIARAWDVLERMCASDDLRPVAPGVIALALVADPRAGAARALLKAEGMTHQRLLDLVQDELIGRRIPLPEGTIGTPLDHSRKSTFIDLWTAAQNRAGDRTADEIDLVAVMTEFPETAPIMKRLKIKRELIETFEEDLRTIGLHPMDGLRSSELPAGQGDLPEHLVALLAAEPSEGLRWLFKVAGIRASDLMAEAWEALDEQAGHPRETPSALALLTTANLLCTLTACVLLVVGVLRGASHWHLVFLFLFWSGRPRLHPVIPFTVGVAACLAAGPFVGAFQIGAAICDWLAFQIERRQVLIRTGVRLTFREWSRFTIRRNRLGELVLSADATFKTMRWAYWIERKAAASAKGGAR